MQFKKLTRQQKAIKAWRIRRNRLVAELLAADRTLLSAEALALANRIMRSKHGKDKRAEVRPLPTAKAKDR